MQKVNKPTFLNTPLGVFIALSCAILFGEFLIMALIGDYGALFKNQVSPLFWEFFDPFVLTILVSPVIYLLIFRPMRTKLDELRRFQNSAVERELRMIELVEEITALRNPPSLEPTGDIPAAGGSPEAPPRAAEQNAVIQPTEESQRDALMFMLEELKDSRQKVEQAHREWMDALDVMKDPIFLHDEQFRILRCNKAYRQLAGIPFKKIIGRPYFEVFPKNHAPMPCCLQAMENVAGEVEVAVGKAIFRTRAFSIHDKQGAYLYSVHTLEDVTERRRAEEALYKNEELYRSLFENMLNAFAYCKMIFENNEPHDYLYLSVNSAFEEQTGLKNVVGKRVSEVLPGIRQSDPKLFETFGRVSQSGKPERFEMFLEAVRRWRSVSVYSLEKGYFVAIFEDITERKRTEKALFEKTQLLDSVIENMPNMVFLKSAPDLRFEMLNRAGEALLGHGRDDLLGRNDYDFFPKEQADFFTSKDRATLAGNDITDIPEELIETPRGTRILHTKKLALRDVQGQPRHLLGISEDITERKRAEIAIQHANRALATLGAVNRALVHATNEEELFQAVCQAIVEQHGYRQAWVGYVQQDAGKTIKVMAHAGRGSEYLKTLEITWADTERGQSPYGRAVRRGVTVVCQNIEGDPAYWVALRDEALKHGDASILSLPIKNEKGEGGVFGVLCVYSTETDAFTVAETDLLEEMAGDLAFGVRSLRTRRERDLAMEKSRQDIEKLRGSLEDTVRAIATIVEMRDPYTAGHQRRVADLAVSIATQLGLPEEQVHGIHLAGVVHDLGKIHIPAEILSKPGKINEMEFGLIKAHPRAGYEILKDINFPWPIAQMVNQHHERLDGSGYPQGLKDGAILFEARILCVADAVEAMSSHRPYRPGLGIDFALGEIAKLRGVHFDPAVVDACLVLFREKNFSFKG